ncbi:MAG: hypothetical protein J5518_12170 [Lachnospiraceae bacterium]|nr:hypothetical protein [Lachnospiraceae bacterium]
MGLRRERQIFRILILFTTVFAVLCAAFFVLMFCAKSMTVSTQLLAQRIEIRGIMGLDEAERTLMDILNEHAHTVAAQTYAQTEAELARPGFASISEQEALQLYRLRYAEGLEELCKPELLQQELTGRFQAERGEVTLDTSSAPEFELCIDEQSHEITGCVLKDVTLLYTYAGGFEKRNCLDYTFSVPSGSFYDGNDTLFEYSLIGRKGIYFTGKTSSVVGNMFAGTHSAEEYRKAESGYGERGIYGGINILSTQVGIEADTVVSTGDINLKGAFVAFGTDEKPIQVYAGEINELAGYYLHTDYTLNGKINARNGEKYKEAVDLINTAEGKIDEFNYYYDTENDETYLGQYRKILSNTDVTLSGDFTGTVVTSGNVIIEADCNVEGLIYAGDRIYVQGNNNIVSNRDVMRRIIKEECAKENADPQFQLREHLGGITYKGMEKCEEEMVAYVITK